MHLTLSEPQVSTGPSLRLWFTVVFLPVASSPQVPVNPELGVVSDLKVCSSRRDLHLPSAWTWGPAHLTPPRTSFQLEVLHATWDV